MNGMRIFKGRYSIFLRGVSYILYQNIVCGQLPGFFLRGFLFSFIGFLLGTRFGYYSVMVSTSSPRQYGPDFPKQMNKSRHKLLWYLHCRPTCMCGCMHIAFVTLEPFQLMFTVYGVVLICYGHQNYAAFVHFVSRKCMKFTSQHFT